VAESFEGLNVEDAIRWGRDKASRVIVRVADSWDNTFYSAGQESLKTLPAWDEANPPSLTRRRLPGYEFLDRTEADDPIRWDALVTPQVYPSSSGETRAERWQQALADDDSIELLRFEAAVPGNDEAEAERAQERAREAGTAFFWTLRVPAFDMALMRLSARTIQEARGMAYEAAARAMRAGLSEHLDRSRCEIEAVATDSLPARSYWR